MMSAHCAVSVIPTMTRRRAARVPARLLQAGQLTAISGKVAVLERFSAVEV